MHNQYAQIHNNNLPLEKKNSFTYFAWESHYTHTKHKQAI